MATWFPEIDVPTLPVVDLVTARPGSSDDDVTPRDLDDCQIRWDFTHVYRLDTARRKDLCTLLVRLVAKKATYLKGSDSYKMWSRVSKDPVWPDSIMSEDDLDEE